MSLFILLLKIEKQKFFQQCILFLTIILIESTKKTKIKNKIHKKNLKVFLVKN